MTVRIKGKEHFHLFWHSDEHTLHPHTPTQHILNNISTVRKEAGVDTMDMEVWGGDLCHDTTQTSDPNYLYLQHWVKEYLADCHERKRTVRILAGTFSHDRNQPEMFEILKPSPVICASETASAIISSLSSKGNWVNTAKAVAQFGCGILGSGTVKDLAFDCHCKRSYSAENVQSISRLKT